MHDPRLSYIYMRKDSLLQCMHEAAAKHGTCLISSISFLWQTKLGFNLVELLWYGRSWPQSQSERGKSNLEWKKNTFILSNYNELVDFLSSGMERPWPWVTMISHAISHNCDITCDINYIMWYRETMISQLICDITLWYHMQWKDLGSIEGINSLIYLSIL